MTRPGTGIVIGRFQTAELTDGHRLILGEAAEHQRMGIVVGIASDLCTRENPLDFNARKIMLQEAYPNATIIGMPDVPGNNAQWSTMLDTLLHAYFPIGDVVLYAGRDSFRPSYSGRYKVAELPRVHESDDVSATEAREGSAFRVPMTKEGRHGMIYACYNQWPKIKMAVDMALTRFDGYKLQVLMGKKSRDVALRFPGGYVDKTDESLEAAAKRELYEETGITVEGEVDYIWGGRIHDPRDSASSVTFSVLFNAEYAFGKPKAADDLAEVAWLELTRENKALVTKSHQQMYEELLKSVGL